LENKLIYFALDNDIVKLPGPSGWYKKGIATEGKYLDRTIFVAVGGYKDEKLSMKAAYFDSDGNFCSKQVTYDKATPAFLDNTQSCPDPNDFTFHPEVSSPNDYPYGAQTVGQTVEHETRHDVKDAQAINEGKTPDVFEYNTDMEAMQYIREAREKLEKSGDDSGYPFVFSLPKEQGGGYILTKAPENKSASIPAKG
jgi:hypothetical protein